MKIVVLDGYALNPGDLDYSCLEEFGSVTIYPRTKNEKEAIHRIGDAQIVLVNKVPITESLLSACPKLRYIGVQATGYNIVDCEACKKHGVIVTNVPTYGTDAVAQFTMALILEMCHQIGIHNRSVHNGDWISANNFCYWLTPQMELAGKTLGIIGYGKIGQAVAVRAKAFGMNVITYSRTRRNVDGDIAKYVDLDTVLSESDILSLHCPQTPDNANLINSDTIVKMKDGAMLVNTARGGLVDETALAEALLNGKLRWAAIDVVREEPMNKANPLLAVNNCIITPHIAWAPIESRQRLLTCVTDNIRAFLNHHPINVVNP